MLKMTKTRIAAAILALVMAVSAIPSVGGVEAQAATKTKVMETKVNFLKDADSGDDSNVYLGWLLSNDNVTFGKSYSLNMDIYVPSAFMKTGYIWIKPNMSLYTGDDLETYAGWATHSDGYSFDAKSDAVTKVGDFYKIQAEMPIDECSLEGNDTDFPEGSGQIIANAFVVGMGAKYTGSIYFDNVSITIDGKAVESADYENSKVGFCKYSINTEEDTSRTPKVVTFTGNALTVSKTALTIKKGKTATIKATTLPSAKATFTSSNKKVATVSSKGVVKGVKKGKATITVKANGKTVKVKVTVK
jgi:hypothetical protein